MFVLLIIMCFLAISRYLQPTYNNSMYTFLITKWKHVYFCLITIVITYFIIIFIIYVCRIFIKNVIIKIYMVWFVPAVILINIFYYHKLYSNLIYIIFIIFFCYIIKVYSNLLSMKFETILSIVKNWIVQELFWFYIHF